MLCINSFLPFHQHQLVRSLGRDGSGRNHSSEFYNSGVPDSLWGQVTLSSI